MTTLIHDLKSAIERNNLSMIPVLDSLSQAARAQTTMTETAIRQVNELVGRVNEQSDQIRALEKADQDMRIEYPAYFERVSADMGLITRALLGEPGTDAIGLKEKVARLNDLMHGVAERLNTVENYITSQKTVIRYVREFGQALLARRWLGIVATVAATVFAYLEWFAKLF
jgi:hypothetical protein